MLAVDPLNSICCEVNLPQIGLVVPAHPTNACSDWDIWSATMIRYECLDKGFPSRALLRSSHLCMHLYSIFKVNSTYMPGHTCDVKENRTHGTRLPSSFASPSSHVSLPTAGTFNGGQGIHEHFDLSAAVQCHTKQCVTYFVLTYSSCDHL